MFGGMFEEFLFEGESEDGKFYTKDVKEFDIITSKMPIEETGISFSGEIEVDENTSVITDKQVKMSSPQESKNTYLKVIEMRDLTEVEIKNISKYRLFFKKLFEVFFKKSKFNVGISIFWTFYIGLNVATDDYLWALIYTAMIVLYNSPIKFYKELRKMVGSEKRKEELREELESLHLMGYVNSVPDDEGVQLYFKPKAPTM